MEPDDRGVVEPHRVIDECGQIGAVGLHRWRAQPQSAIS